MKQIFSLARIFSILFIFTVSSISKSSCVENKEQEDQKPKRLQYSREFLLALRNAPASQALLTLSKKTQRQLRKILKSATPKDK